MGNSLTQRSSVTYNKTLISQLRQSSLTDLLECVRVISEDYPDCTSIDLQRFTDIFGSMIDDPEPLFILLQNDKDINGVVDIYETLAVFAVFAREKFEKKAAFVFQLFDFDKNGTLDLHELSMTLQSVARGLCKSTNIPPPSRASFEKESENLFLVIDSDHNKRISFDEFMFWINSDRSLQDFLLEYAGTQTFQNLSARFQVIYDKYLAIFNMGAENPESEYVKEEQLYNLIKNQVNSAQRDSDIKFLFEVLRNTTAATSLTELHGFEEKERLISRDAYEDTIKAWCVFFAADLNSDDFVVPNELHALLWLYEEKEPSKERVEYEMKEMGNDDKTGITMLDWLKNLCIVNKYGKYELRPTLKKLFEKYDIDNSGYLSMVELKELVKERLKDYIISSRSNIDKPRAACVEGVMESLTKELFIELDANNNTHVSWEEFKAYIDISPRKFEKVKEFLRVNL